MVGFADKPPSSTEVTEKPEGFLAVVFHNGKRHQIGFFPSYDEASKAAQTSLRRLEKK